MSTPRSLREFHEHTEQNQAAIARELGLSATYYSELVRGLKTPSLRVAVRITNRTGIPVERLLAGPGKEETANVGRVAVPVLAHGND